MLHRLDPKRGGNVRLARAKTANQQESIGPIDELAAMELANQGFVDLARRTVERGQVLAGWEPWQWPLRHWRSSLSLI